MCVRVCVCVCVKVVCSYPLVCEFISIPSKKAKQQRRFSLPAPLPRLCVGKTPQNVIELNSI